MHGIASDAKTPLEHQTPLHQHNLAGDDHNNKANLQITHPMKMNNNLANETGNPLNESLIECLMRRDNYLSRTGEQMRTRRDVMNADSDAINAEM